ncbi:hypothetical protein [Chitiniphilus eburneus]|uniref:Uncharacterized protein n=1 Tax=Chitiniphilus eburneus TaxID=2571148 RepID=A0A4U0PI73_9NEIS|nr:hypothetical protein [Chitiniphilus eburneus]TJZ66852.1 hypothetical protein FAZ21_16855 [Chitiniphilus eburneus]
MNSDIFLDLIRTIDGFFQKKIKLPSLLLRMETLNSLLMERGFEWDFDFEDGMLGIDIVCGNMSLEGRSDMSPDEKLEVEFFLREVSELAKKETMSDE